MIVSTINVLNGPTIIVISPDGSLAYVAEQYANAVSVVDLATVTDTADISVGEHPIGLAITPDGTQVYVADQFSNSVSVIDTSTYTVVNTIPITTGNASGPIFLAVTPDGSRVYVGTNDNLPAGVAGTTVNIIDTSTQTVVNSLTTQQGPLGVAISGDGQQAFVTNYFSNSLSIVDIASNTVVATVAVGPNPLSVAASPLVTPTSKDQCKDGGWQHLYRADGTAF